jgi:hypothetical protein
VLDWLHSTPCGSRSNTHHREIGLVVGPAAHQWNTAFHTERPRTILLMDRTEAVDREVNLVLPTMHGHGSIRWPKVRQRVRNPTVTPGIK